MSTQKKKKIKSTINKNIETDNKNIINSDTNKDTNLLKNKQDKENYKRPEITYTDKLSKDQIKELLIDYEKINNITELINIPSGTHLRYFEMKNKELKFRTGGILTVNSGLPDYIILSNGKLSWSVQVKPCIFFKRITIKQIREEYEKFLYDKDATIKGQQTLLNDQQKEIKNLKQKIKELEKRK